MPLWDAGRESGFGIRDPLFASGFEVRCSGSMSKTLSSIEYLAKLHGQRGCAERLLNEVCFARFDVLAKHRI